MPRCRDQSGSIAILALWGVAVIAILLAAIVYTTRSEIAIAGNVIAASRARLAAEAGTQLGLSRLLRRHAQGNAVFDGTPEAWRDGTLPVEIAIADEAGKIDINLAPLELLSGLFVAAGEPQEDALLLACDVLDYRGETAGLCPEPGESSDRGRRFAAVEEVAQLPGVDEALYDKIADCLTVASGASAVDPLSAPRLVLLALPGASDTLVDGFLESRHLWRDMGSVGAALGPPAAAPFLTASPRRDFTITAIAATPQGARHRADLQVRLSDIPNHPYEVLGFREPPADRGVGAAPVRRVP